MVSLWVRVRMETCSSISSCLVSMSLRYSRSSITTSSTCAASFSRTSSISLRSSSDMCVEAVESFSVFITPETETGSASGGWEDAALRTAAYPPSVWRIALTQRSKWETRESRRAAISWALVSSMWRWFGIGEERSSWD